MHPPVLFGHAPCAPVDGGRLRAFEAQVSCSADRSCPPCHAIARPCRASATARVARLAAASGLHGVARRKPIAHEACGMAVALFANRRGRGHVATCCTLLQHGVRCYVALCCNMLYDVTPRTNPIQHAGYLGIAMPCAEPPRRPVPFSACAARQRARRRSL